MGSMDWTSSAYKREGALPHTCHTIVMVLTTTTVTSIPTDKVSAVTPSATMTLPTTSPSSRSSASSRQPPTLLSLPRLLSSPGTMPLVPGQQT